jgi:hypothetical protein
VTFNTGGPVACAIEVIGEYQNAVVSSASIICPSQTGYRYWPIHISEDHSGMETTNLEIDYLFYSTNEPYEYLGSTCGN